MDLKTNVVKKEFVMLVEKRRTHEQKLYSVYAESLESAKLRIPECYRFIKEVKTVDVTNAT